MSSSPALELPVVPLNLRGPIEPPVFSAQGDLVPSVQAPSPFQPEFSPVVNVQNVDARQIHQQALFVNDRSAQVAQMAELRHQAILAEHGQQVADEARQYRDAVANQARATIEESREQHEAIANQRLSDMSQAHQNQRLHEQRAYLDRMSLERHAVIESERALARQREDALRSELAEQSRIIKDLRERFDNASGNRVPVPAAQPLGSQGNPQFRILRVFALNWRSTGSKATTIHIHQTRMKKMTESPTRTRRRRGRRRRRTRARRGAVPESAGKSGLLLHLRLHPVHLTVMMIPMTQALSRRVLHVSSERS